MKILFVNPHEYNFQGLHHLHTYPTELYNSATLSKRAGHEVDILDMYPEGPVENIGGDLYRDGVKLVTDTLVERRCGNYESEKFFKGVLRIGLPVETLRDKLKENNYDRIIVYAQGSKTCVTSTCWSYVFMGVYEIIDICKEIQPDTEVVLAGEYAKLAPEAARESKADIVVTESSSGRHFVDTDIDLFEGNTSPRRINLATSYGCQNGCAFCFVPHSEGSMRVEKPVEDVLNFIEYCVDKGETKFRFLDSNLLCNWDNHLKLILEGIIDKGWNLDLTSYGGVEPANLTEDIADTMVAAGFKVINVPLDNTSSDILTDWGGNKTLDAWEAAANIAVSKFDHVLSYIMVGFPGQKYANAVASVKKCNDKGIEPVLCPFNPVPSTAFEDNETHPEEQHCMLYPYASADFTVDQIEDLISDNSDWYTRNSISMDTVVPRIRIYRSSPPITNP